MRFLLQSLSRLLGLGLVAASIYYVNNAGESPIIGGVLHVPSLIFISGIALGITLCSFQVDKLFSLVKTLIFYGPTRLETKMAEATPILEEMSEVYYNQGGRGLSSFIQEKKLPPVWNTMADQLESKIPESDIKALLQYNAGKFEKEIDEQIHILCNISSITPSIGMLGTVLGMIQLLSNLKDMGAIGPHMSLAFICTLYGISSSIIFLNPLIGRLESTKENYLKIFDQAFFWIHIVENKRPSFFLGVNPFNEQKEVVYEQ